MPRQMEYQQRNFPFHLSKRHSSRLRIAFFALAIFALVALLVDGILLNVAFNHPHPGVAASNGYPTLTLSPNAASRGSMVNSDTEPFFTLDSCRPDP